MESRGCNWSACAADIFILLEIDSDDSVTLFENELLAKSSANLMLAAAITVNENT